MNTSALESKIAAFKLLQQISENLGSAFTPFCEAVLPVALADLTYAYSKAIRKSAMKICVNVLSAVGEPLNVTVFGTALYPAFIKLVQEQVSNKDLKNLKTTLKHFWLMLKALNENKTSTQYMDQQQFNVLGPLLGQVLSIVKEVKTQT